MATVMSAVVPEVRRALESVLGDEACRAMGVEGDVGRLKAALAVAEGRLPGLERKEVEDAAARFWLDELRRAMYAAEDFVDDYWRHRNESKLSPSLQPSARKSILQKLGIPLNRRRLEHKDLKESLKNLCGMFSFISESSALPPTPNNEQSTETEQGSQLDRSNSYLGADILYHHVVEANDKFNSMLDNLINDDDDDSNIIVLAIVGAGGIGKTTQARKLFDNPRARSAFDITIWLSLSTDFTDTDLLSAIISAGGGNPRGLETRADFETMLSRIIKKKRCLIMLDNVVSGHIYEDFLEGPLNCAARGSRILITTRDKNVAAKMKAVHIYEVQELSCEDGWKLLYNRASLKENEIIDLKEIGQKIAERCNGIPLAINTIGSVLRTKRKTEFEWLSVHANSAWSFKDHPRRYGIYLPKLLQLIISSEAVLPILFIVS